MENLQLKLHVDYAGPLLSSTPECLSIVDLIDLSDLFEVGRHALGDLEPRKRFATALGVTAGSTSSGKGGSYFVGPRNVPEGISRRDDYLAKNRLGNYDRHYWGTSFTVDVGVSLSRPATRTYPAFDRAWLSGWVSLKAPEAEQWAGAFSDAMFTLFERACAITPPMWARVSWVRGHQGFKYEVLSGVFERAEVGLPSVPGYRTMLYLPPQAVETLGGVGAVKAQAPVLDVIEVYSDTAQPAVVARLCRTASEITTERLEAWREYLLPVVALPDNRFQIPDHRQHLEPALDLLPIDYEPFA